MGRIGIADRNFWLGRSAAVWDGTLHCWRAEGKWRRALKFGFAKLDDIRGRYGPDVGLEYDTAPYEDYYEFKVYIERPLTADEIKEREDAAIAHEAYERREYARLKAKFG